MSVEINKASSFAGKLKVWQNRVASYISIVNFVMIFYLYIIESPMGFEWYHWLLIIITSITSIIVVDTVFIFPASQEYTFDKNPRMVELRKQVNKNKVMLEAIIKHFNIKVEE